MLTWVSCQVSAALVCVQARMALVFVKWLHEKKHFEEVKFQSKKIMTIKIMITAAIIIIIIIIIIIVVMKLVIRDTS